MSALTTLRRAVGVIWSVIASPWRLFQSIRHSMTPASASVLIISIMTLNIIWGYPWTGMFAATLSMLTVGWLINRAMHQGPGIRA